ncbi:DUF5701 family protein [Nonomuraea sp. NPDC052129]|uniref:DUF5701 family protein n=1 Tax=Nonomuraea sp. NPDC052129 TaxID=3154651 RepID=UPI00341C9F30
MRPPDPQPDRTGIPGDGGPDAGALPASGRTPARPRRDDREPHLRARRPWCWERDPHTWLGMASAGNRRAAA